MIIIKIHPRYGDVTSTLKIKTMERLTDILRNNLAALSP